MRKAEGQTGWNQELCFRHGKLEISFNPALGDMGGDQNHRSGVGKLKKSGRR